MSDDKPKIGVLKVESVDDLKKLIEIEPISEMRNKLVGAIIGLMNGYFESYLALEDDIKDIMQGKKPPSKEDMQKLIDHRKSKQELGNEIATGITLFAEFIVIKLVGPVTNAILEGNRDELDEALKEAMKSDEECQECDDTNCPGHPGNGSETVH